MINWTVTPQQAWMPRYQAYVNTIPDVVEAVLQARAAEIEAWMKANHRWRNRTGLAESGLSVTVIKDALSVTLVLYYNRSVFERRKGGLKFYPVPLETIHNGARQFSVLEPALDYFAPMLLDDLKKALK